MLLKKKNKDIKIFLSDPKGSALYNFIKNGELKSEGGSITEGIGSSRITANFKDAKLDDAYSILASLKFAVILLDPIPSVIEPPSDFNSPFFIKL
jgi:cysteine synthase